MDCNESVSIEVINEIAKEILSKRTYQIPTKEQNDAEIEEFNRMCEKYIEKTK